MKKLLFLMVAGIGIMSLKGHVALTTDNQVRVASWSFPVPPPVLHSPLYPFVTTMLMGQLQSPYQASSGNAGQAGAPGGAAQPARPAMPNVSSANGTYSANAPAGGAAAGADTFNAASKALR